MFLVLFDTRPDTAEGPPTAEDIDVAWDEVAYRPLLFPTAAGANVWGNGHADIGRHAVVDLDALKWRGR